MVNFALLKSAVGYADDTSNSSCDVQGLNSDSKALFSLSKELGLVLNPSKTQCVIYGSVKDSGDPILVDGVTIEASEKIKILGFTLKSHLQPDPYLKELADSVTYVPKACGWAALGPSATTCLEDVRKGRGPGKNADISSSLSLKVRLSQEDPLTNWGRKLQVILNDVAKKKEV